MSDLISRDDALKAIDYKRKTANIDGRILLDEVEDRIRELPSDDAVQGVGRYENAMQKLRDMPRYLNSVKVKQIKKIPSEAVLGEWKPISDGTPQRVGSYLVTCKGEHGFIYVDYDFWTVSDEFKYHHDNVIAWMPLPTPYKGGDTE